MSVWLLLYVAITQPIYCYYIELLRNKCLAVIIYSYCTTIVLLLYVVIVQPLYCYYIELLCKESIAVVIQSYCATSV